MVPVVALVALPFPCIPPIDVDNPTPGAPAKHEDIPPRGTLAAKPPPTEKLATLPDEVVLKAIDSSQGLFLRCFKRANNADPTLVSAKVKLHVELDSLGVVVVATSDAPDP